MTAVVAPPAADEPAPASSDGAGVPPAAGGVVVGSGARARHRRRVVLLVLAAVAVGLALRVAISLTDDAPSTDETAYLRSGIALVDGEGFTRGGRPELHFPPFVPFLLGLGSKVFADAHTGTVVLTCVASTAIIVPLALLARRIAGATAAVATAWVAALAPGLSTTVVNRGAGSEAVYMLLVVGALWLVVSGLDRAGATRLARLAAAGALVGLAYLTRPEGLFVALPLGLAVLVVAVRGAAGGGARRLRAALVPAAAFGVPIVACVVPYAAYLHAHTGTWELSAKTQDASIAAWHAVAQSHREERDSILWAL
ncbi:MAG TPA: glycosyltransferase family 39 protein, partial [Acidimicrobiales bacterium]